MSVTLHPVDIILLSISFLSVFVINYVCSKYRSTSGGHHEYFLTSRSMPFWAIGASLYASNIGTEHFVGQSGAAAASGIPVCLYEWSAIFILVLQIWIFAPVYLGYKPCPGQKYLIRPLSTIPEWFENRFDYRSRLLVVIVTLFMYVLTKISTLIFASGVLFKVTMGWSLYETIPFLLIFTGIYTMTGGLRAIMINDVVQMTFFTIGGCIGAYYSLFKIGGLQGIREVFKEADIEYFMHWYRGSDDAEYPSSGMFTGLFIVSIWVNAND
jgi:SSS family solute:Na+ symporter